MLGAVCSSWSDLLRRFEVLAGTNGFYYALFAAFVGVYHTTSTTAKSTSYYLRTTVLKNILLTNR